MDIKILLEKVQHKQPLEVFYILIHPSHPSSLQLYKKRLQHRRFPVNIAIFLRIPNLKNICHRLLLVIGLCCYTFNLCKMKTKRI